MSPIITAKFMETNLKYGKTVEYFTNHFNITDEEFFIQLEKTFSKKAYKWYLNRLKKNEKIRHKVETDSTETKTFNREIISDDSQSVCTENNHSTIEDFKREKEKFEHILNSLELQHKDLVSERIQIKNSILWYRNQLNELQESVFKCKNELSNLLNQLNSKLEIMHALNCNIAETKTKISEIDKNIEELKKISIFFYQSGDIELETEKPIEIPILNEELFKNILSDEQSENYTLKELKSMVKAISLVLQLKAENLHYDLIFEKTSLEDFFLKKLNEVI